MSWVIQLKAVLQKNYTLALRNRRDIFRELFVPILLLLGLSSLTKLSGGGNVVPANLEYPSQPVELFTTASRSNLWFSPCSPFVSNVTQLLGAFEGFSLNATCFPTEAALLLALTPPMSKSLFAAVVFDSLELPIRYRIRMDTSLTSGVDGSLNTTSYTSPGGPNSDIPGSYIPNFLPLQYAIDGAVGGVLSPTGLPSPIVSPLFVQHFPTPSYVIDTLAKLLVALVPLYLTFIFTLQVRVLLTAILLEKEKKIRVSLRMQGLPEALYYLSWAATAGVKNTILVTFTAAIVCASGIWARSSVVLVWLFFFGFMLSCIAFCFAASSLFSKSRTGGALGFTLYLLLSLPSYSITQSNVVTPSARLWLALMAPCGFNIGAAVVTEAEGRGQGINAANWMDPASSSVGVSLAAATAMLFLDALLYLTLAFYLDKVVQGEFGTVQHPCFCLGFRVRGARGMGGGGSLSPPAAAAAAVEEREALLPSSSSSSSHTLLQVGGHLAPLSQHPATISSPSSDSIPRAAARAFLAASALAPVVEVAATPVSHSTVGVCIHGLTKVYDTVAAAGRKGMGGAGAGAGATPPPPALDHLTVDIKQGEVTVLLGHNGAGKTTLASILTGFIPATAGDAVVFGRSVANDIEGVQAMIGLCPQHDVLFDQLTVAEHLRLWGGIKLLMGDSLEQRIVEMIKDMGLEEKRDAFASTLSGGQKRRLSVAIALIGNPKLLVLDEPTSGLDPAARRLVWGAINKHKAGRCTILITHFMDEAEILGDTILLMARGRLRIAGSPLFLKNTFGLGYTLTVTAGGASSGGSELAQNIKGIVCKHVASAEGPKVLGVGDFGGNAPATLSHQAPTFDFVLPRGTEGAFAGLLSELEGLSTPLTLTPPTLSISMATLEECFCALEGIVEEEERMLEEGAEEGRGGGFMPPSTITPTPDSTPSSHPTTTPSMGVSNWLDIRRRAFVHGPLSLAKTLAGECGLPPPTHLVPRNSLQFLIRQVKVQLWRLGLGGLRDWRSLALQTALPIVTTGASLLFRLLTAVNASNPDPIPVGFTPAALLDGTGHTPLTLPLISSPGATSNDTAWLNSTATLFPATGSPIATIEYPFSTHPSQDLLGGAWLAGALMVGEGGGGLTHPLTLLYNGSLIHSLPTLLNLVDSAALALSLGYTQPPPMPLLSTAYHPLPRLPGSTPPLGDLLSGVLVGFYAAIGFCVIPAVQVSIIVGERESGCKQQQYIMGAGQLSYWVSRWLYDSAVFLPPAISTILILTLAGPEGLTSPASHILGVASLVIVYGISSCWYTYVISFLFRKAADAQLWTRLGLTLLTMGFFSAHLALALPSLLDGTTPSPAVSFATHAFDYLGMLLVPPYILAVGLGDISVRAVCFPFAGPKCIPPSPFAWDILGSKIVFLLACIPVWGALVLYLERRELEGGGGSSPSAVAAAGGSVVESGVEIEDRDVREERARVMEGGSNSSSSSSSSSKSGVDGVELRGLRKVYVSRGVAKVAVCDVSLKLEEGEIFGLLGPNGAGKSSLLGMLTGSVTPSGGVCFIAGVDSVVNRREAQDLLGYAPQFDALFPFLTAQENLEVYAALNGTPPSHLPALVREALEALDLTRYAQALSSVLSGGNKRRLSLAAALIASPRVCFLDEVTTGVDPVARRRMGAVLRMAKAHRTIVLTTHLVEEAESLCARVGVLVTGRLACLASPSRLKALYGSGYKIDVALSEGGGGMVGGGGKAEGWGMAQAQRLLAALQGEAGPGTTITLEGGTPKDAVQFSFLASPNLLLSGVFRVLEGERGGGQGVVREYGISQAALENVFLKFTRVQEEADERIARLAGSDSALQ